MRRRCGQVEIEGKIGFEMGNLLKDGVVHWWKEEGELIQVEGIKKSRKDLK